MQTQTFPIDNSSKAVVAEIIDTIEGFEEQIRETSTGGFNVILGENLDATDQTEKIIHAVASNGYLLASNLPPHE